MYVYRYTHVCIQVYVHTHISVYRNLCLSRIYEYILVYTLHIYMCMYTYMKEVPAYIPLAHTYTCGVATINMLLKIISLFCKRAL